MKKLIITFLLFLFFMMSASAQDLLIKNNGDTLAISIIEMNNKYLVYHNLNVDTLTVFTTPNTKLNKIIYANGKVHSFEKLEDMPFEKVVEIMDPNKLYIHSGFWGPSIKKNGENLRPHEVNALYDEIENLELRRLYRRGRTQNTIGNVIGIPTGYLMGVEIYKLFDSRRKTNTTNLAIGIIGGILSISLNIHGVKKIGSSVDQYNEAVNLSFESTDEGVGLVLNF